jgi:hypothetical protein
MIMRMGTANNCFPMIMVNMLLINSFIVVQIVDSGGGGKIGTVCKYVTQSVSTHELGNGPLPRADCRTGSASSTQTVDR